MTVKLVQDLPGYVQLSDLVQLIFAEAWDLVLESIELPDLWLPLWGDFFEPALLKFIVVKDFTTELRTLAFLEARLSAALYTGI